MLVTSIKYLGCLFFKVALNYLSKVIIATIQATQQKYVGQTGNVTSSNNDIKEVKMDR
jgi:hypothetical protein